MKGHYSREQTCTAIGAVWPAAVFLFCVNIGVAAENMAGVPPNAPERITCVDVFPDGNPKPAVVDPHFPSRLHAFVWRNWESVSAERMAMTVGTTPRKIREIGLSMGLPKEVGPITEFNSRGYVTIIRHNWHLLPYEQLLTLLDWDIKTLDFHLSEDDFLFIKLGNFKPVCDPIRYVEPDARTLKRCGEIKAVVHSHFGAQLEQIGPTRFDFVKTLSRAGPNHLKSPSVAKQDKRPRFLYSYFALYGDPFSDAKLDPFPDGLLQRLSASGVDGIWLQALLRQISPPTPTFPEFGQDCQKRLMNLRTLVNRANRYGIEVFLYISEPRAMPPDFFHGREDLKGASLRGLNTMCTSTPEVLQWVSDSLAYVFRAVPGLGGVFTISKCENPTSCYSDCTALDAKGCPRCSQRSGPEVIAEINNAIAAGVWQGDPEAKVLVWDWIWPDEWMEPIVSRLATNAYLLTVSEWDKPLVRGGIASKVDEYSMSAVGPSERAQQRWALARKYGLKTAAKLQVNTTWELSTLPYLPVLDLVAEHCANLAREDMGALMLSWSLGGCPSPNLKLVELFSHEPAPTVSAALHRVATEYYGPAAATDAMNSWSRFSTAFAEYPFSRAMLYLCPIQQGPANLLYPVPTGYDATMVGFSYDALQSWTAHYPVEVFASQFEKVAAGWKLGLAELGKVPGKTRTRAQRLNAEADLRIAEAAYLHFQSVANQVRFTHARNTLLKDALTPEQRRKQLVSMRSAATAEVHLARRLYQLAKEESRIGFEATNQYHYLPLDLVEKVVNCEYVLRDCLSGRDD